MKRLLIWGGRSQARIAYAMMRGRPGIESMTLFDATLSKPVFPFEGELLTDASVLKEKIDSYTHFVVCVGAEHGWARCRIAETLESCSLEAADLIHEDAFLDESSSLGRGAQVMPGVTLHKFCTLGEQCILNTGATIDHECALGKGVHVMGSAAIAGRVSIGDYASIGTNATILPDLKIGEGAYVGAGAVVTKDVDDHCVVAGNPARKLREIEPVCDESLLEILNPR